ncbi:MAG: glucose-1-phosphate adenylyltransferase [Candidatus Hydrogenedentes bacterium]|nr:glucose-1-phosphate adenylyltransferase [Candidatus Hydrogenedentota bacterium]
MRNVGAIVLGGGRGTRLYPLTKVRAKPAVPLCGRYRLVDVPLSNCINSQINRVSVLTQYNSHSLNRHINNTYRFDMFSSGMVEVLAAEQTDLASGNEWFQGTADAVRKQFVHILDQSVDYYVILSGDQLYRMDYRELLHTHLSKGADITVSALPVSREDAQGFGIMKVLKSGRIREFVEKPTDDAVLDSFVTHEKVFEDFGLNGSGRPYLASMGVYVFNKDVLERLLMDHVEWVDFGKELIPNSLGSLQVYAHMFSGFWEDIGTVRSYFDVSMAMTTENAPFKLNDQHNQIYTHARALPGVRIADAHIKNAIICEGSRVTRAKISNSIVGIRGIIHPGATLDHCIVLGAEYFEDHHEDNGRPHLGIGEKSNISHAIIDHNARIGKGVTIRGSKRLKDYDGDGYAIRDGIVVVYKNAVIPDGAVIGAA